MEVENGLLDDHFPLQTDGFAILLQGAYLKSLNGGSGKAKDPSRAATVPDTPEHSQVGPIIWGCSIQPHF